MIVISKSKSIKQPFIVKYLAKNGECLSTSELLKSKKAAFKNIYSMAKNFTDYMSSHDLEVKDLTVPNPEVFVYDINGVKKKAGVRK